MLSFTPSKNLSIPSPFKFLDSYQQTDWDKFFGREKETKNLIQAFRKSSLVVLYGPSGSGKTSLINCGFFKKLKIDNRAIVEIRRGSKGLIHSIAHQFFKDTTQQDRFCEILSQLQANTTSKKELKGEVQLLDQKIIQEEAKYQRGDLSREQLRENIDSIKKEQSIPTSNYTQLQEEVQLWEEELLQMMSQFQAAFNGVPYLIFDQFEEIFTSGKEEEEVQFGVLLNIIFKNNLSLKLLLSLREEYFSKLKRIEQYLPQILFSNCLVDNPSRNTIYQIIEKSFEKFKINQVFDKDKPNGGELLSPEEKNKRIDHIIEQLESKDENQNRFFLPFLQIYLDKLYKEDFKVSHPDQIGNPDAAKNYLPIEFELSEIEEFGDIKKILNEYITDTNEILVKGKNRIRGRLQSGDNIAIKFLRIFCNEDNTKKRIPTERKEINGQATKYHYEILEEAIKHEIQLSIWGKENYTLYQKEISKIIQALTDYKLIKYNDGHTELNHDVLAKVVNEFQIERPLEAIFRDRFISDFEVYQNNDQKEDYYLKESDVAKYQSEIDYILSDFDDDRRDSKTKFWDNSKQKIKEERQRKLKEQEKQINRLRSRNRVIGYLCIGLIGGLFYLSSLNNKLKISSNTIESQQDSIKNQIKKSNTMGQIHQGAGDAFKNYKSDRTKSYQTIQESEGIFQKFTDLLLGKSPSFIGDFKNDLYRDFNKYPFYSNNISLPRPFSSVKHITTLDRQQVQLFILDDYAELTRLQIDPLHPKTVNEEEMVAAGVHQFLPYIEADSSVSIIIVKQDSFFLKRQSIPEFIPIGLTTTGNTKSNTLVHLGNQQFITNLGQQLVQFSIRPSGRISKKIKYKLPSKFSVKHIYPFKQSFIVQTKEGALLHPDGMNFRSDILSGKNLKVLKSNGDSIVVVHDKKVRLKRYTIEDGEYLFSHSHEDAITCLDFITDAKKQKQILLGSEDRTASIWINGKEKRKLIGHTDRILDIAFLDRTKGELIMTASADKTIKIWNLKPIEKKTIETKGNPYIHELHFHPPTNRLYAGVQYENAKGYLLSFCDSLIVGCEQKHHQYTSNSRDHKGHITSFDFGSNQQLLLGGYGNKLIASAKNDSFPIDIRRRGAFPTITSITTHNKKLLFASAAGIFYCPDYTISKVDTTVIDTLTDIRFNAIDYHPSSNRVVAGGEDGNLYVWNLSDFKLDTLQGHLDNITDVTFSQSGNWILSGSKDNSVRIWLKDKEDSFEESTSIIVHTNDVTDVEIYNDELFLTASSDNTVQLFTVAYNGETIIHHQIPSLIRHDAKVTAATFSPDGINIYSGDSKGTIKKWAINDFETDIKARIPN